MAILLTIDATTEQRCHEALSMAFALAAFDHTIQLELGHAIIALMQASPEGRLAKMLRSLPLYDMPAAWVDSKAAETLRHCELAFDWQVIDASAAASKDRTGFDKHIIL